MAEEGEEMAVETAARSVSCWRCSRTVATVRGAGSTVTVVCKRCGAKVVVR